MTVLDSNVANFFRTQLTATMGPFDLEAFVTSTSGLSAPSYIVIEPTDATQREVILCDGTWTATKFAAAALSKRYLSGSGAVSGITHPVGSEVWCVPLKQHFDDLHDRIEARSFNVKDYGALGDGTTDDYAAVQRLVAAVNAAGGGTVIFPPGTYLLDQYVISGGASQNSITDVLFTGCDGISVLGYGATIEVKGNFNQLNDGGGATSYERALMPMRFNRCNNVHVAGLVIDGNADQMTRAGGVTVERASHLLGIYGCENVVVENVELHHGACDGLILDDVDDPDAPGQTIASKNLTIRSVYSHNNARQGVTVGNAARMTFEQCRFTLTGLTEGAYGSYAPKAGCDIEPGRHTPVVDVQTGDIVFRNCEFTENVGGQITCSDPLVSNVVLEDCRIIAGDNAAFDYPVVLSVQGGVIRNCYIDVVTTGHRQAAIFPSWGTNTSCTTLIEGCEIHGDERIIVHALVMDHEGMVVVRNNRIYCDATAALTSYPIFSSAAGMNFRDNYFWVSATGHDGVGNHTVGLLNWCAVVEGNYYDTDLVPSAGTHFSNSYDAAKRVVNEHFKPSGTKPYRPSDTSSWDPTYPFGSGSSDSGSFGGGQGAVILTSWATTSRMARIFCDNAVPASGTWLAGDIVLNTAPAAGAAAGWQCTAAGTPGTWKTLSIVDILGSANTWASKQTFSGEIQVEGALNHDGTTVGFFGITPTTRPAATAEIKAALALLGLLTDGGVSPLDLDGGTLTAGAVSIVGLTGSTVGGRFVGFVAGTPASGAHLLNDLVYDTTNDQLLRCSTAGTPGTWTPAGMTLAQLTTRLLGTYRPAIDLPSAKWTIPVAGTRTTNTFSDQQGVAIPLVIEKATTLTGIGINVSGAGGAGSVVRLGIYNDSSGVPGTKVLDAGTVDSTGTGALSIVISQALSAGKYWLVACPQGAPGVAATLVAAASTALTPGVTLTALSQLGATALYANGFASGAFPSSFGGLSGNTGAILIGVLA